MKKVRWTLIGLLVVCGAALLAACGESPADAGQTPKIAAAIEVESGADQVAPVTLPMPDSVVAQVLDDADLPVAGRLVNFEVPAGEAAGSFDGGALETNAQGRVFNELEAGTRAWTARVADGEDSAYTARLVASNEGRPDEVQSFPFAVEPEAAVEVFNPGSAREGPNPLNIGALATDQYGNPAYFRAEVDSVFTVQGTNYGSPAARTLQADTTGEAVVCIRSPDSLLAVGKATAHSDGVRFEVHGADDPDNQYGEIQPTDCR